MKNLTSLLMILGITAGHDATTAEITQSSSQPSAISLTKDDVLSVKNGRFYLDGQPFAEISFNKFDLFWQLYDQLAAGKAIDDQNPLVQAQEKALRNLQEMGFKTIRIFALPWGPGGPEAYVNPGKRRNLYAALDKTLELCDKHCIRVVWSLGAGQFTDKKYIRNEKGENKAVWGEEHIRDLVANPASRGRQLLYAYLAETINRYKNRKAIILWEIHNELTLSADIAPPTRIFNGERKPDLAQIARFFDDVAKQIKMADPLRLVSSGGCAMRESQWNLYTKGSWAQDTIEEQFQALALLYADSAIDIVDIHWYPGPDLVKKIAASTGKGETVALTLSDYMKFAARLRKPLMIGEFGLKPAARATETDKKIWERHPAYFERWSDTAVAKPWMKKILDTVIEAQVPLSFWWTYQSDRVMDQNDPQRFDIDCERNPELVQMLISANNRLKSDLLGSERQ